MNKTCLSDLPCWLCVCVFLASIGVAPVHAASPVDDSDSLKVWYPRPAQEWSDALPIGNGRLGAMVYGGVTEERWQLNEDTLWSGGPQSYDNPDAFKHLAGVRELLERGEYAEAESMAQAMMGEPLYQSAYQPLGDLYLRFPDRGEAAVEDISEYLRQLDLRTAVTTVNYRVGDANFTRKSFASYPDQVIVMRLECDKPGWLSFDLQMTSPHPAQSEARPEARPEAQMQAQSEAQTQATAGATLFINGQVAPRTNQGLKGSRALIADWDGEGVRFAAQVEVAAEGGTVQAVGDRVSIRGADVVTLYYSAATSFVNHRDTSGNPTEINAKHLAYVRGKTYDVLFQRHVDDYLSLFNRVEFNLGGVRVEESEPSGIAEPERFGDSASLSTDQRIQAARDGQVDPILIEQVFQYGRYLMIAGSRPGSQPLNLQGIWNNDLNPRWGSKYTININININIEMNYWVAEVGNLSECHEPLLRMVSELEAPGTRTAQVHYQADGWMAHHNPDLWRGAAPVDGAQWGMWPMGGAWLCQHLWEHYLYSKDSGHLQKSYPLIKGATEFFLCVLVEDENGDLVTSPSLSPEHSHGGGSEDGRSVGRSGTSLCAGPKVDLQILRDLFANCIDASETLGIDEDFRGEVAEARSRLAPMKIGRHGQLQEWQVDWDNPEDRHSHVSRMYGLFPSHQINRRDTPELFDAARTSMIHRGFSGGWPGAWRIALWVRLDDGDRARTALTQYVIPRLATNLFNGGEGFQIDAKFGATAGIAEMLLQSDGNEIHLLPALPQDWPSGSVTGLRARGGYEVDINWIDGKLKSATVRRVQPQSKSDELLTIQYASETRNAIIAHNENFLWKSKSSHQTIQSPRP